MTLKECRIYIRANCLPEMRKDRTYKIIIGLEEKGLDILYAVCHSPAGQGPSASCEHIAALCFGLVEFSFFQELPE